MLLIVDYLFDWARDIYRDDVIKELRVLASGDNDAASSANYDSEIYSTLQPGTTAIPPASLSSAEKQARDVFSEYDSKFGVIRHAKFAEHRYVGLIVNKDNLETLFRSTQFTWRKQVCQALATQMSLAMVMSASEVVDLEALWCGSRPRIPANQGKESYRVVASFYSYLSPDWHIIRELFTVSIAEDCIGDLFARSGVRVISGVPTPPRNWRGESVVLLVSRLGALDPRQVLLAAINRVAARLFISQNECVLSKCDGRFRALVHFVYATFQRGVYGSDVPWLINSDKLQCWSRPQHDSFDTKNYHEQVCITSADGLVPVVAPCYPIENHEQGCFVFLSVSDWCQGAI